MIRKFMISIILFVIILIISFSYVINYLNKIGDLSEDRTIIIDKNYSIRQITNILYNEKIINDRFAFFLIGKLISLSHNLKAGEYKFTPHIKPKSIFNILINGKSVIHKLVIIEGISTKQILTIVENEPILSGAIGNIPKEGELFPDTYFFSYGDTKQLLIDRMHKKMQDFLSKSWEKRDEKLPLSTMFEALILASIVEKETYIDKERKRVASVFINRISKGMKLQSDPTTIYAITLGETSLGRNLTKTDLLIESEFNTYFTNKLPPSPICNPGKSSIEAVMHPAETDELFFVVDANNAGHKFSNNYQDHMKNVQEYRKSLLKE